jgi:hypothetical protein
LSNVKVKNDKKRGVEYHFVAREKPMAPLSKGLGHILELVEEVLVRFVMAGGHGPSSIHHRKKTRNARPKILEFEGFRSSWATIIGEKERAMAGKGGG